MLSSRSAPGSDTCAVVRPYWNDAVLFKRLLDIGVQSFLVPFVESAEEARQAVAATRYPPDANCATAWGEFTCWTPGGCSNFSFWAFRYPDYKRITDYVTWPWWVVPYGTTIHTPQMFDGYGYWVDTCVQGYWGGALTCTGGY